MLDEILSVLRTNFTQYPPHTIQRLSELVLFPRQHYRNLVPYLHALDRVVHVTSGANTYPLPPALPEIGAMSLLANGPGSGAAGGLSIDIAAANTPGSDEALGGALLTPIPWLARRANGTGSEDGSDAGSSSPLSASGNPAQFQLQSQQQRQGGQLEGRVRTESTETIEGPNGIGSIETVSVSVNGIPSTGAAAALLTQRADLVRQQQQQAQDSLAAEEDAIMGENVQGEDEDEIPHARGPEEIGLADTGPQSALAASYIAGGGTPMDVEAIDVEAAVGRRVQSPPAQQKREAADHLEPESPRKRKKDDELASSSGGNGADQEPTAEQQPNNVVLPDATAGTLATDSAAESSKPEEASATNQSGDVPSEPVDGTGTEGTGADGTGADGTGTGDSGSESPGG